MLGCIVVTTTLVSIIWFIWRSIIHLRDLVAENRDRALQERAFRTTGQRDRVLREPGFGSRREEIASSGHLNIFTAAGSFVVCTKDVFPAEEESKLASKDESIPKLPKLARNASGLSTGADGIPLNSPQVPPALGVSSATHPPQQIQDAVFVVVQLDLSGPSSPESGLLQKLSSDEHEDFRSPTCTPCDNESNN
ncbi:hypothetical protein R1flu_027505 [Riccia fluitans]|uniref:Uncharacterized protein n=1 Tax=Riccia fluitans TaxID=41844 RepID=A0ABD1XJ02_9MARC